jgi:DNA replication and repair protein RecF
MLQPLPLSLLNLSLRNFRTYSEQDFAFQEKIVVLHGPNGSGKTNLLEAISLLSPGRGLRGAATSSVTKKGDGTIKGWKISARTLTAEGLLTISAKGGLISENRRSIEIEKKTITQVKLGYFTQMLWIIPAMDRIWNAATSERRRLLDRSVLSFAPDHAGNVIEYEQAMRERNCLFRQKKMHPEWLDVLESRMAKSGIAIAAARVKALHRLNKAQEHVGADFPAMKLRALGPWEEKFSQFFSQCSSNDADYDESSILEFLIAEFSDSLRKNRHKDLQSGRTTEGPHLSDFDVIYTQKNLAAKDCSTGEQKMLLLGFILTNVYALKEVRGIFPILLLDEVSAHLDEEKCSYVFEELLALGSQIFLTGVDRGIFSSLEGRAQYLKVEYQKDTSHITMT